MKDPDKDSRCCFIIRCPRYPKCGRTLGMGCTIEGIGEMDFDDPGRFIQPDECRAANDFPYFIEKTDDFPMDW